MNKELKFSSNLVELILTGERTATWRLWDDKDLSVGDQVDFLDSADKKKFAEGKVTMVIEKPLGQLTSEDKKGHEVFENDQEMYGIFTGYYQQPVNSETPVKVVRFEII